VSRPVSFNGVVGSPNPEGIRGNQGQVLIGSGMRDPAGLGLIRFDPV